MKTFINFVLLALFAMPFKVSAQEHVRGLLTDDQGKPVAYANVFVLDSTDSSVVASAMANKDGCFEVSCTDSALLRISHLGHVTTYKLVSQGRYYEITLPADAHILSEVMVKGALPITQIRHDALVTNVANTYLAHLGSAYDVLCSVPGVSDYGESIEVIGKGKPAIYLNGRRLNNLAELRQVGAATVKEVEVVTNPDARYDATVGSVIRITTIKLAGEGLSVENTAHITIDKYTSAQDILNLNLRIKRFDFFGLIDIGTNKSRTESNCLTTVSSPNRTWQRVMLTSVDRRKTLDTQWGMNFVAPKKLSVGLSYAYATKPLDGDGHSTTSFDEGGGAAGTLLSGQNYTATDRRHRLSGFLRANVWQWNVEANIDALWTKGTSNSITNEQQGSDSRMVTSASHSTSSFFAQRIQLSRSLWIGQIDFGWEHSRIERHGGFENVEHILDDNRTYTTETNNAFWGEYEAKIGKASATLGLRYERISNRYEENSKLTDTPHKGYENLFPTARVNMPLGKVYAMLSYARKISRPPYAQLSNAVAYVNRFTYESGNPQLQPMYKNVLSLILRYRWAMLMLDYTQTENPIVTIYQQYLDKPEISLLRRENADNMREVQVLLLASPSIGSYHVTFTGGIICPFFTLNLPRYRGTFNRPIGILRANNTLTLSKGLLLRLDLSWRSSGNSENMWVKNLWQTNCGVTKRLGKHWDMTLEWNDIFTSANVLDATSWGIDRQFEIEKRTLSSNVRLTLKYAVNNGKRRATSGRAGKDEMERLK